VDAIYMTAVQMLTGGGGWPMTVATTPDRKPFFGGTYFPAKQFLGLLKELRAAYDSQPDRVAQTAEKLTRRIQQHMSEVAAEGRPDASALSRAADYYRGRFDSTWGGLQSRMKFPSSLPVRLLLRIWRRTGQQDLLRMATLTLDRMAEVACTITWAAVSTGIRPTRSGSYPTSRRCSMTTRFWP
jgi:hypothetical protein